MQVRYRALCEGAGDDAVTMQVRCRALCEGAGDDAVTIQVRYRALCEGAGDDAVTIQVRYRALCEGAGDDAVRIQVRYRALCEGAGDDVLGISRLVMSPFSISCHIGEVSSPSFCLRLAIFSTSGALLPAAGAIFLNVSLEVSCSCLWSQQTGGSQTENGRACCAC